MRFITLYLVSFLTSQPKSCLMCLNLYWPKWCGPYVGIKDIAKKNKTKQTTHKQTNKQKSCLTCIIVWKKIRSFIPGAHENEGHVCLCVLAVFQRPFKNSQISNFYDWKISLAQSQNVSQVLYLASVSLGLNPI